MALSAGTAFVDVKPKIGAGFQGAIASRLGPIGKAGGAALAGGLAVGVAGAAGAVAGGIASVMEFADFEQGMNEVFTLLPDLSETAMSQMTDDVQGFAREMGVTTDEVVPALYQSISAGVPPGNVFDFLETAQQAALGGVTDLETAVDGISSVVNAYGDDVVNAGEASDLMFTAVRLGKTNFEELSSSLFNVTPTASALGVQFQDVTAALAAMTAQGTPTSVATTQLRQLLVELSKDGSKASEAFEEVAGVGFQQFIAEGGNVAEALAVMEDAAGDNGVALQDMFGSVEAGSAALSLTGSDAFTDAIAEMGESAGATETAFDTMDQGLARSWEKIKANVQVAMTEIGGALAPFVAQATEWFADVLPTAIDFFKDVVANLAPIFQTVFDVLGAIFGAFKSDTEETADASGTAISGVGEVFGTLGEIIGQVTEVIQIILGGLQDFWAQWGGTITALVSNAFETIVAVIGGALDIVKGIFDVVLGILTGDWSRAWDGIKGILSGALGIITGLISGVFGQIVALAQGIMSNFGAAISNGISNVVSFFTELPGRVMGALAALPGMLVQLGKDLVAGLISGLGGIVSGVGDKLKSGLSSAVNSVKSFFGIGSPSKVIAKELGLPIAQGVELGASATADLAAGALIGGIDEAAARAQAHVPNILGAFAASTGTPRIGLGGAGPFADDGFAGGPGVGGITIEEGGVVINYPTPEKASVALPRELRHLATSLSR